MGKQTTSLVPSTYSSWPTSSCPAPWIGSSAERVFHFSDHAQVRCDRCPRAEPRLRLQRRLVRPHEGIRRELLANCGRDGVMTLFERLRHTLRLPLKLHVPRFHPQRKLVVSRSILRGRTEFPYCMQNVAGGSEPV